MVETHDHFVARLSKLGKKHAKMTHGYVTRVGRDGLITVTPRRRRRGFPFKLLLMFALGFLGLKTFMVASVGPVTYNERLAKLEKGTVVEQAGAKVLAIDPVTEKLSAMTGPVLR
ncbi:hypothetical protein FIU94_09630 [Sulfitobacter sp. THAF37]|uniref:hypothetical protein n=1 Tax=Sulfitobacter sp. THAF37 TaxID=2587855 RepID=UPI0012681C75|nr:hypothetical protein [Sulfitobacter sp. THAF37]QFT59084.1 hypothetical protein FIU94_09630 [Sulfitobacter sp. THAF37]